MTHRRAARTWLIGMVLVVGTGTPTSLLAQTPAAYEATLHGRTLACFGAAYALVELVDVATLNLSALTLELGRPAETLRPPLVSGLLLAGSQFDQRQALDVAERLATCTEGLARSAVPDSAAAFAATAALEEISVAINMAQGFSTDYEVLAPRLERFLRESATPSTTTLTAFSTFAERVGLTLARSRTAIGAVIAASTPTR
jgi:hypothetical protein